jgi:transcriptional regulator NrdR family protein
VRERKCQHCQHRYFTREMVIHVKEPKKKSIKNENE